MARLTRLVLMFASIVATVTVAPAPSSAGVIPWAYNAVFGPVGSLRGGNNGPTYVSYRTRRHAATTVAYAPATAYYGGGGGCSTCNQSSNYAPSSYYSASYAPYTTSYAPSYGYDGFYGNYSQTANYGGQANYGSSCCNSCSGCSTCNNGCSSCSNGGCSSSNNGVNYANFNGGSTCSNCSVNSAPMPSGPTPAAGYGSNSSGYGSNTSGYGTNHNYGSNNVGAPVPDPYNSRDINARLNELEHRQTEDEKFLRKLHKNDYQPDPYSRPSTYRERDETVPARRRNTTIDSNTANPDTYEPPIRGRNPAPAVDPLEEDRRKPVLAAPTPLDDGVNGKGKDGAVNFREDEPQTRRLEDRSTTQAIAPKQRMQIVTKQTKAMIAKSNLPVKTSSATSSTADLAKN